MSAAPALVRPRVTSPHSGETLLLQDLLEPHLQRGDPGVICIQGEPGSGKTSALRSLAAAIPKGSIVELLDEPHLPRIAELSDRMLVVYAATQRLAADHRVYSLAPWAEDEALEYVLAAHKERCASVMRRLRATPPGDRPQAPALWRICLDRMAEDESIADCESALRRHLDRRVPLRFRRKARLICYRRIAWPASEGPDEVTLWGHRGFLGFLLGRGLAVEDIRLLRYEQVRMLLAAERLAGIGEESVFLTGLGARLSLELIRKAGALLAGRHDAIEALQAWLQDQVMAQPMGASLLHATGSGWRPPDPGRITWFWGAHLAGAEWPGSRLSYAQFTQTNLAGANLSESTLDQAEFTGACLRGTRFRGSSLNFATARGADLSGADLSQIRAEKADFATSILREASLESALLTRSSFMGCDLRGANFRRANLTGALFQTSKSREMLESAVSARTAIARLRRKGYKPMPMPASAQGPVRLEEADFTGANLEKVQMCGADLRQAVLWGARFFDANLAGANLEGVQVPGGHFEGARLYGAHLTGSVMPGASFRSASLSDAKLADVEWEKADLRGADLRKASFHMGSSRSGLLFGGPSEGTRSGFYTDEYYDQSYRSPEEIRTANLRGADLREAIVLGTDFYLVDLREALFSPEQEEWFRRCGAILETRV
ncbi:MAG: pentapeptide repeat-containing protein [Planctomycetes bacterium]|nr:pentapeptide repeat-containing protein [Planctomycetota bacterium]